MLMDLFAALSVILSFFLIPIDNENSFLAFLIFYRIMLMKLGKLESFFIKQTTSVPSKALNSFMRQKQVKFSFSLFLIQEQGPARFVREPNNKAKSH
jgi:hypothetical protein